MTELSKKLRVLILPRQLQRHIERYRERFDRHGIEISLPPVRQALSEPELLEIIRDFDGVIAGDDELTAHVLEAGRNLRVVIKWGIGVDGIDLEAAARLGIEVRNTPGAFGDEVADVVIGYLILLARRLHELDRSVRSGGWAKVEGSSLAGKTLGIIGIGNIGQALAKRARVIGMSVVGCDPIEAPGALIEETGLRQVDLDELLGASDFVSVHCPLAPSTRRLLDGAAFERMKDGAFVVNTSRGAVIDEAALIDALRRGKLGGAALDVYEHEPLPEASPLRELDNCIFGTHNASNTLEAVLRVNELTIGLLLRELGVAEA